jgi:hypothetical protein
MDLDIAVEAGDRKEIRKLRVSEKAHVFRIPLSKKPLSIGIDPDGWVLKSVTVEHY